MELTKIGLSNETFYYGFSGKKTTDIIMNAKLKSDVNVPALNKALRYTVMAYPLLGKKIVVKNGNIYYTDNEETPMVYKWDNNIYKLGTSDTNYFLFRVMYKKDEIIMFIHHGLIDGKGTLEVINILLSYYVDFSNDSEEKSEETLVNDSAVITPDIKNDEDLYEKYGDVKQEPFYIYKNKGAFVIPEQYYAEDDPTCRKFKIVCKLKDVLKLAKRSQSTPVPVMSTIISEAIQNVYGEEEKDITAYVPVDLRKMFNFDTISNSVIAITLPYSSRLNGKEMDVKCTVLRGIMDLQIQKENFIYRMGQQVAGSRQRENLDMSAEMKQKIYIDRLKKGSRSLYTYLLSYVGKIEFPDRVKNVISDFHLSLPAYLVPLNVIVCTDEENLILSCTQNFKTDKIIKKIVEIMNDKGIEVSYEDLGEIHTDSFEFETLPHIED